jgi:hypothetical protein
MVLHLHDQMYLLSFSNANQAGQYIVTAIGRCGTKKDTVSFVSPTGTFVNIGKDTSICQGSYSDTKRNYKWNNRNIFME